MILVDKRLEHFRLLKRRCVTTAITQLCALPTCEDELNILACVVILDVIISRHRERIGRDENGPFTVATVVDILALCVYLALQLLEFAAFPPLTKKVIQASK
jgi:hypothetical protein